MGRRVDRKQREKRKALKHRHVVNAPAPVAVPCAVPRSLGHDAVSELFAEFLAPYQTHVKTEEQLRKLALLGIVAWNAAIAGGEAGEQLIQLTEASLSKSARAGFREIIASMIVRKVQLFNDNKAMIASCDEETTPNGLIATVYPVSRP